GIYSFDVVRQALEPTYGLAKAKEIYEAVVMHHLTNGFVADLFNMAGVEVDFEANRHCFLPGRAEICGAVHGASMRLTRKMRPEISAAAARPLDQPPAVERAIREAWAHDPDADVIRGYLSSPPAGENDVNLIARLQAIFDDVQQMTLLGLPKWVDI